MKKIILLSVATTFILSSCGIYSKYKPATEVPEGLYGATDTLVSATGTANLGNLSWREVFTDPHLQMLIDSALVRNTDLQTAHLRVKEAEATLLSARLSYLPSFSLSPQGTVSSFDGAKASDVSPTPSVVQRRFLLKAGSMNRRCRPNWCRPLPTIIIPC